MVNKILKPHQVSVNLEEVVIGNIDLTKEEDVSSQTASENDVSQNDLDRYIDQDDFLEPDELLEMDDDADNTEADTTVEELPPAMSTSSVHSPETDTDPQPSSDTDSHANEEKATDVSDSHAHNASHNSHEDNNSDTARSAMYDHNAVSVNDSEAVLAHQQLQEMRRKLAETEDQLATLQQEYEQECATHLQHQEEYRREIRQQIEQERQEIIDSAQKQSEQIITSAHDEAQKVRHSAREEGYKEGFDGGGEQIESVVERLRGVTGKIIEKRQEILTSIESQMIDLVLLIARKVIKILTTENKNIVVENVRSALDLVRKKGEIIVRINPTDLRLSATSLKQITELIERDGEINFIEDSSIEVGGCLVETEFGEIDARIHSQILSIENKIRG